MGLSEEEQLSEVTRFASDALDEIDRRIPIPTLDPPAPKTP